MLKTFSLATSDKLYLLLSTIISSLLNLVLPFSILIIFDRILPAQSADSLLLLMSIIIGVLLLDLYIKQLEGTITTAFCAKIDNQLNRSLFRAIKYANIDQFQRYPIGYFQQHIAAINQIKHFFGNETIRAIVNAILTAITLLIITLIHPLSGAILALATLILAVRVWQMSAQKEAFIIKQAELEGASATQLSGVIRQPLFVKATAMEYRVDRLLAQTINLREEITAKHDKLDADLNLLSMLIQQLTIVCVVVVLASSVISLSISQGIMAAIIMLANRYFSPLQQSIRAFSRYRSSMVLLKEIQALIEAIQTEHDDEAPTPESPYHIDIIMGRKNIQIRPIKTAMLQGRSGVGKSMLCKVMAKQLTWPNVRCLINGIDIQQIDHHYWRKKSTYINAKSSLIEGTIIDNVTSFEQDWHNGAYRLCDELNIRRQIDALPDGFYTQISPNRPHPFSRQVGYALEVIRALLTHKQVLLLDDLDSVYSPKFIALLLDVLRHHGANCCVVMVCNHLDASLSHQINKIVLEGKQWES